ncbi:MAG: 5-(carboxyamino)imidazole ribonucleotide synthase [Acidimicrobiales bacterium]
MSRSEASCAHRTRAPVVGIVGAGQLARMLCESASALGIDTVVMAERLDEVATPAAGVVVAGSPRDRAALAALAGRCDVVTFDHELVDLPSVAALAAAGVAVRPGVGTLEVAVDKSTMRRRLAGAGVPVPPFADLPGPPEALGAVERFAATHRWPVVLKAARGGYDGRGVWPVEDLEQARAVLAGAAASGTPMLVEAQVPLVAELAVLVARSPSGASAVWPAVETAQVDGVCRELVVPARLSAEVLEGARELGHRVAEVVGSLGVLAVELFWTGGALLVNEVAARPHNSGHWTIEGAVTSQFENHLRAVLDLPLGSTALTAPAVASVNVFGAPDGAGPYAGLADALSVPGAHVHLYGKGARPGRKLGHVTVVGERDQGVRSRAWAAAVALGTPVPEVLGLEVGAP